MLYHVESKSLSFKNQKPEIDYFDSNYNLTFHLQIKQS